MAHAIRVADLPAQQVNRFVCKGKLSVGVHDTKRVEFATEAGEWRQAQTARQAKQKSKSVGLLYLLWPRLALWADGAPGGRVFRIGSGEC